MSLPPWHEEPIARHHDRAGFDCGEPALNAYLARYARQNHDSGGAKTFLAVPTHDVSRVLGYYTLAPASIDASTAPRALPAGLGRYELPVFRLGRLAVASAVQGRGLGGRLLLRAGKRCLAVASQIGGVAVLIDAKDARAATFYRRFGAQPLADAPLSLLLPLKTVARAIAEA